MRPEETQPPSTVPDVDLQCPECAATLDRTVGDQRRTATDGGRYEPDTDDERELLGVDVACDDCGTELGIYFFP